MSGTIRIILPGLFDLPLAELGNAFITGQLPWLNRLLRFADPVPNRAHSIDAMLKQALLARPSTPELDSSLPLAQACNPDPACSDDHLLLFEAVHLRPDLHSAVLLPIEKNAENLTDIDNIINDLREIFKADCDITVVTSGLFLMRLHAFSAPVHYPHILSVLGKSANPYIEQSRAILPWYRLLNEMQMYLHQHAINETRLRAGKLALNSLWFWGGGAGLASLESERGWFADDWLLNRFAAHLGLQPRGLDELTAESLASNPLVIDLRLLEVLKAIRVDALDELLYAIDLHLLEPLMRAAAARGDSLWLSCGFDFDFELKPGAGLKFWRRRRTLGDFGNDA